MFRDSLCRVDRFSVSLCRDSWFRDSGSVFMVQVLMCRVHRFRYSWFRDSM